MRPDKIYIPSECMDVPGNIFETEPSTGATVYIRKDALLKWISEARAIPREFATTRDLAFQEVVNYLNTM